MSTAGEPVTATTYPGDPRPPRRRPRPPRQANTEPSGANVDGAAGPSSRGGRHRGEKRGGIRGGRGRGNADGRQGGGSGRDGQTDGIPSAPASVAGDASASGAKRPPRQRNRKPKPQADSQSQPPPADGDNKPSLDKAPRPRNSKRAPKFNAKLSEPTAGGSENRTQPLPPPSERYRNVLSKDDLTSRLIDELSTPPYPDCPICFAPIHPAQPTYSCSPLITISAATDDNTGAPTSKPADTAQCCWTTFHLKCIRSWASKSVKDIEDAWRARGEERKGEWRCPGCQAKREVVPTVYWCFCGSTPDPKPPRLAMPHSCASPCTRPRACGHPCPISCHPGPCPPCQVTTQTPCFCGKQVMSFRCANLAPRRAGPSSTRSCGKVCGKKLNCGNHTCEVACHDGPCAPCTIREVAKCYCGKTEKELGCGIGEEKQCVLIEGDTPRTWVGRFPCESKCGRLFDCGIHHCEKPCHVPSPTPEPCPRSPSLVKTCPCGKHTLDSSSARNFPPNTNLTRTSCTDPVPTCESTCMKPLDGCSHKCAVKCHTGPCPPCSIAIVRPCRCGLTTRNVRCVEDQQRSRGELEEILCDRQCTALRACRRHECHRLCCPLASLANATKGKGKKKATPQDADGLVDEAGWHACDLICGKPLSCGNHTCEERDHQGACPPCLRSSWEEMVCHCGRTVLEPPIPCGTRINCRYPCTRPLLACGHPKIQHACHEDPVPCPPCVVLTTKLCACGKKEVGNVRCSLAREKVSCGTVCGKLLSCGFHHCDRLCHSDGCGTCHAICGKSRKLCLPAHHPCTAPCHAPAACSEAEPCRAAITITCPCGRIRQSVPCGRSTSNPAGQEGSQQLKCSTECQIAKRNARLAEALGISGEGKLSQASYSDDLVSFARANIKFCQLVEKTFADFVNSDKKSQILPHMPESRRKFVHDLAAVYRMDTQMVDQEPYRSVQLFKRIDSRVPTPLLSSSVSSQSPTPSLGKLADLRAPIARPASGLIRTPASGPTPPHTPRGWTSVVTRPASGQASPSANPAAWLLSNNGAPSSSASAPTSAPRSRPLSAAGTQPPAPPLPAVRPTQNVEGVPDNWEDEA